MIERLALGLCGAALVAAGAWRVQALTRSGAVAATAVGTAATVAGFGWAAILIVFFVASTALSRLGAARKAKRTAAVVQKHGGRDAAQVFANGGIFAIGAALLAVTGSDLWSALALGALVGAFADSAATEVGTLIGGTPRSIIGGGFVVPGMSGGVTMAGSLAALGAALALALTATVVAVDERIAIAAFAGGLVGVTADSLLGALVQVRRWCPACAEATERDHHSCGAPTRVVGGLPWLNNDGVNAAATLVAGAVAAALLLTHTEIFAHA